MRGAPKCSSGVVRGGPKLVMGFQLVLLSCVILGLLFLGAIKGIFVGNVSIVLGTYIPGPIYCLSKLNTHTHTHTCSSPIHAHTYSHLQLSHTCTHILTLAALPYMYTHTHTCSSPIHVHTYSHLQLSHTCTHILTLAALPYMHTHTHTCSSSIHAHIYSHFLTIHIASFPGLFEKSDRPGNEATPTHAHILTLITLKYDSLTHTHNHGCL